MVNEIPYFWRNDLDRIKEIVGSIKKGKSSVLTKSGGGRDIYLVEYGEKQDMGRRANYSSACSYKDISVYANKTDKIKPVILIAGATHGGEIEGISAILNLLEALETGMDYRKKEFKYIYDLLENYRILIIPCLNPDGRSRVPFSVVSEVSPYEVVYYKHGLWKDGTLADYTQGFRVHPIINDVQYMGGYYNDEGINLSADRFTYPMAVENRSIMELVDREAPDAIIMLHTGCHVHGKIMQPRYLPGFVLEKILQFDRKLSTRFTENGFGYYTLEEHGISSVDGMQHPPMNFDMCSAIHHTCGGLCFVYESYEAAMDRNDAYSCENILDCHFLMFEEVFKFAGTLRGLKK